MKAVVTGAGGTVGTTLCDFLKKAGHQVVPWDRRAVPIDDYHRMESFLKVAAPDCLFHLAIGFTVTNNISNSWAVNYEWTSELAWLTRTLRIRFVFTSTAMVFTDQARGPFTVDSTPDAREGYGYEKRKAEERCFEQNPDSRVVRLGWQIGACGGSNNMFDFLDKKMREEGVIKASAKWLPACSFLEDTASALHGVSGMPPGLYQIDANKKWTFYDIACALNARHGRRWTVEPTSDFIYDQRLIDPRIQIPTLEEKLPELLS